MDFNRTYSAIFRRAKQQAIETARAEQPNAPYTEYSPTQRSVMKRRGLGAKGKSSPNPAEGLRGAPLTPVEQYKNTIIATIQQLQEQETAQG